MNRNVAHGEMSNDPVPNVCRYSTVDAQDIDGGIPGVPDENDMSIYEPTFWVRWTVILPTLTASYLFNYC